MDNKLKIQEVTTRPNKCEHCDETFSRKCDLVIHTRMHNVVKPFSCNHCTKKFASKSGLKYHLESHSDSDPSTMKYQCKQ